MSMNMLLQSISFIHISQFSQFLYEQVYQDFMINNISRDWRCQHRVIAKDEMCKKEVIWLEYHAWDNEIKIDS